MRKYRAIIAPLSRNSVTVLLTGGNPDWNELDQVSFHDENNSTQIEGVFEVRSIEKHAQETTYNLMPMP